MSMSVAEAPRTLARPRGVDDPAGSQRVVSAAVELMSEVGFERTTLGEVSKRAGMSKGALYYWFKSKDDLLAAVIQPIVEDVRALVENTAPSSRPRDRHELVERYVDLVERNAASIRLISNELSLHSHPALMESTKLHEQLMQRLAGGETSAIVVVRAQAALGAIQAVLLYPLRGLQPAELHQAAINAGLDTLGIRARAR